MKKWNRERTRVLLRFGRKQSGPWDWDENPSPAWRKDEMPDDEDVDLVVAAPKMLAAIKSAMAIKDLWLPAGDWKEHEGEAQALESMGKLFQDIIEEVGPN